MALIDLPTETMVTITAAWLDREKERPIIERCPRVAPLLDDIAKVHEGIVVFQNKGKGKSAEVLALQAKTSELDEAHDRIARGLRLVLNGLSELCRGYGADDPYSQIESELFPRNLQITRESYLVQAGEAPLREQRLSDESKRVLEATVIRTPDGTQSLRDVVNRWGQVAQELGAAEAEKSRARAEHAVDGSAGPARRAWAKVVSLFVQTLELETGLSEAERRAILLPLQEAEAKAAKRKAAARDGQPFGPDAAAQAGEGNEPG